MVDLKGIDLNLLTSLVALIEEANVTRAAERLNISQPALSAQLARLRDLFRDPLLVPSRSGRGMVPTLRARELHAPLVASLREIEAILRRPPAFDPATAERTFSIAATDNATVILGLGFVGRVAALAWRGLRVSFRSPSLALIGNQLERGEVDLLIGSQHMVPPGMRTCPLFEDSYLMAQRKGHPRGARPLDLDAYCGLSHILVSTSGGSFRGHIDEQLALIGRSRRVVLSLHQFSVAPLFLKATDWVATLPARFVGRFAAELDVFPLPFAAGGYSLSAAWHPRFDGDPGHAWLRARLRQIAVCEPDKA